jgi:excisionase family DNA binding protein
MQEQTRAYLPPHPTVREVAAWYGVDIKTVRRWIAAGRLAAHRIGPHLLRRNRDEVLNLGRPVVGAKVITRRLTVS